jgi:SNF2 family DNA or RNA helicase
MQLYIGGKQNNLICIRGNAAWLPPGLRKVVASYFTSWNALRDIAQYQQLKQDLSDAYGQRHFEGTDWASLEALYEQEMQRLSATLHGLAQQGRPGFRIETPPGPAAVIGKVLKEYAQPDGVLRDPFNIWRVEKLLRRGKVQLRIAPSFTAALQQFGAAAISIEARLIFFRQLQAYHVPQFLAPELGAILEPALDAQHTLRSPQDLDALAAALRRAGANLRVLPDAVPVVQHYVQLAELSRTGAAAPPASVEHVLGDSLRVQLYPFQREGVAFLVHNRRALLADDMGLGKTFQAIAGALYLLRTRQISRVLIICPASLKYQWQSEIHRFTSERCEVIGGDRNARLEVYRAAAGSASLLGEAARPSFYVVNYELVQRDLDDLKALGAELLILDEAQRVKNYQTKTYKAMLQFDTPYAFVLTGTPLENQLMELYTIMRFIDDRALGTNPLTFRDRYVLLDRFGSIRGYQNTPEVSRKLASLVLRRTKQETLSDLPPLIEKPVWLSLNDVQRKIYRELRGEARELLSTAAWDAVKTNNAMVLLQRLREVCDTPELIDPLHTESQKLSELQAMLADEVGALDRQAIIFTQWTRMGEILMRELQAAGYDPAFLHGGLDSRQRNAVIDRFKRGAARVFVSTDAGGVGLNLQNASLVINFDLPFNPAKLAQRIGRAWRIGQENTVVVVNLLCKATVEESMLRILEEKQQLFDDVFGELSDPEQPRTAPPQQRTLRELLANAVEL